MTAIVINPQKLIQSRIILMFIAHLGKKGKCLGGILKEAKWLRFEAKVQLLFGML